MKEKFYVTTPIYYPSGKFHIGTAYTEVLANTMKKYKEKRGYDTYLLTGVDEHGQKVEQVAIKMVKRLNNMLMTWLTKQKNYGS